MLAPWFARALAALTLVTLAAAPSRAQQQTGTPVPARQPAGTPAPAPIPVIVPDGRFDVVLLTHASAAALGDASRMREYYRACRRRLAVPPWDSLAVIRSRTWDWSTGGTADPDNLTFLVSRTVSTEVDCLAPDGPRATAFARGFRLTSDTLYPYVTEIASVTVRRGERVIPSGELERIPSTRITMRGLVTVAAGMVRLSVPIDSFAPGPDGQMHDLELEIASADSSAAHVIAIPWVSLRPMWEQVLRSRSSRLASAAPSVALLAGLDKPDISAADLLDTRVRLGSHFAEGADTASARVVLGRAVLDEPCLTLGAASPALAREIVANVSRPRDRCRASIGRTVVQATLLPGLGQTRGITRKLVGAAVLGAVVRTLLASQTANDEAKSLYAEYLAVDGPNQVVTANLAASLYDRAESRRIAGTRLVMLGAGLWGASIAEATFTEYRLTRRLARVQDYQVRARSVGPAPGGSQGRLGLSLNFF